MDLAVCSILDRLSLSNLCDNGNYTALLNCQVNFLCGIGIQTLMRSTFIFSKTSTKSPVYTLCYSI